MNRVRRRTRTENRTDKAYIDDVVRVLLTHPEKVSIIKGNIEVFRAQPYLKQGLFKAIERLEWTFEAYSDIDSICAQIQADDFIGQRIRRYPLLFKGVL